MFRSRVPIAISLLLAAPIAGCVSQEEVEPATRPAIVPAASPIVEWVDRYWNGKEQATVFSGTVTAHTFLKNPPFEEGWSPWQCVRPEPGVLVPPGTLELAVTADYDPPPTMAGAVLEMEYWTSDNPTGWKWEEAKLLPGSPTVISLRPEQLDGAFQARSFWKFCFSMDGSPGGTAPTASAQVSIVAWRGAPVADHPPAPNPLEGRSELVFVPTVTHNLTIVLNEPEGTSTPFGSLGCKEQCEESSWWPEPGTLLPPGSERLHAELTWDLPGVSTPTLYAWTGGRPATEMTLVEDGENYRVFEMELAPEDADSLYQRRSLAGFYLWMETADQEVGGAGLAALTLTAVVTGSAPAQAP